MPVVKIPIQHRFGVISHSQKVKLQENILQELTTQEAQQENKRLNDPVEKCENLVNSIRYYQSKITELDHKINSITEQTNTNNSNQNNQISYLKLQKQEVSETLDFHIDAAFKQIQRAKRRSGISTNGEGEHVNLTLSWTELAILNRIEDSKVRTECLQTLALSMSISPLTSDRIVFTGRLHSLVFVAQSLLFWLDGVINDDSEGFSLEEFTCLRVLYFIFLRFWTYITLGILNNERHGEQLENLLKYVQMIDEKTLELYRNYPDAAYCVKIIFEVKNELARLVLNKKDKSSSEKIDTNTTQAEILDELLIDDMNIHAKLIRDIAPSLYQAIDLFRRFDHKLTPEDWRIFSKTLEMDDSRKRDLMLLDKIFTIGILGVLSCKDLTALEVYQEFISYRKMDERSWTENYLSVQSECFMVSYGRTSLIKRAALVTEKRNAEEGTKLCNSSFRPSLTMPNLGGIIDMLNYKSDSNATSWIIQAAAISSLIRVEKHLKKDDPLKPAILNLIQSFDDNKILGLDERVLDGLILAKAASEIPNSEFINDQNLWKRCAELFSETLLPNMSIAKTLKESKVLEVPKVKNPIRISVNKKSTTRKEESTSLTLKNEGNKKKATKISDYGQKKFNKREDKKLKTVVQEIWDSQLHSELEAQLSID